MTAATTDQADGPSTSVAPQALCYDSDAIKRMLPHRWPMLMIDRAFDVLPGVSGRGVKSVSVNEPFFAGHYPNHSIMPGVMIIESMAQLVAVIYVAEALAEITGSPTPDQFADPALAEQMQSRVGYLGAVRQVKFSKLVVPGDQLQLEARMGSKLGGLRSVSVSASVDSQLVAGGTLTVSERGGVS